MFKQIYRNNNSIVYCCICISVSLSLPKRARLLSAYSPHASSWLQVVPAPGLNLHLDPSEFQAGIKWWLGIDSSQSANCPYCPSHCLDPLGHHALTCKYRGDIQATRRIPGVLQASLHWCPSWSRKWSWAWPTSYTTCWRAFPGLGVRQASCLWHYRHISAYPKYFYWSECDGRVSSLGSWTAEASCQQCKMLWTWVEVRPTSCGELRVLGDRI